MNTESLRGSATNSSGNTGLGGTAIRMRDEELVEK
jgi:hypothetical protein